MESTHVVGDGAGVKRRLSRYLQIGSWRWDQPNRLLRLPRSHRLPHSRSHRLHPRKVLLHLTHFFFFFMHFNIQPCAVTDCAFIFHYLASIFISKWSITTSSSVILLSNRVVRCVHYHNTCDDPFPRTAVKFLTILLPISF